PGAPRVTSMLSLAPWVTPGAPLGSKYSCPSAIAMPFGPADFSLASRIVPADTIPPTRTFASTIRPRATSAQRVSPMPRSISHSGNGIAGALQQQSRLRQWQAHNVGIASGDVAYIDFAIALQRIGSGLARA